ncbi:Retrovirus-related Pol poly from transposon, partial [Paramuricea clavata]
MDVFVTRSRTLSKTCVFGEQTDEAIRDQAIDKCVSKELRRPLLREPDIDLSKLLTISRAFEQSHFQAQEMEQPSTQPSDSINAIRPRYNTENSGGSRRETPSHINTGASRGARNSSLYNQSKQEFTRWRSQPCYCCGNTGRRAKDVRCPANGKTCRSCNKVGHFASVCRVCLCNQALQVSEQNNVTSYSDDDECIFRVQQFLNLPTTNINVDGLSVPVVIDSGPTVNIADIDTYYKLRTLRKVEIMPSNIRLFTYGSTIPLNILGTITVKVERNGKQILAQFVVVDNQGTGCLLGHKSATELDLLHVANSVSIQSEDLSSKISAKFPKVFEVPKPNGEVRICVDMRRVNTAVIRERYPIPTVEEILQDLTGACVFSKLDLRWEYHQIELDEQSRHYTTFATHTGLYRYKRLMFGVSAASEIYQHVIQQSLQGCPGMRNISDDITVFGKTQQEHDHNLNTVLATLQECGLPLNRDKCKFSVSKVTFFGYTISANGIRPTDETVTAIRNAPKPSNALEVLYGSKQVPTGTVVRGHLVWQFRQTKVWLVLCLISFG